MVDENLSLVVQVYVIVFFVIWSILGVIPWVYARRPGKILANNNLAIEEITVGQGAHLNIELGLATVAAPILVALAALILLAMLQNNDAHIQQVFDPNDLLCVLGILALSGAAVSVEAYLDHAHFSFLKKISLAKGGYLLFCLVVSGLNAATLIFYSLGQFDLIAIKDAPVEIRFLIASSSAALLVLMLSSRAMQIGLSALVAAHLITFQYFFAL